MQAIIIISGIMLFTAKYIPSNSIHIVHLILCLNITLITTNINTIKVEDDTNGVNADTIYINGSENPIKTKLRTINKAEIMYEINILFFIFLNSYNIQSNINFCFIK